MFARCGAIMTSIDLTIERVKSTSIKFQLLGDLAKDCAALQCDAQNLSFSNDTFDLVYSNGVLHHTLDTQQAIDEVYRVLKLKDTIYLIDRLLGVQRMVKHPIGIN